MPGRNVAAAIGGHQAEKMTRVGWLDDGAQWVIGVAALERFQNFGHDVDAIAHGHELFDVFVTQDNDFHDHSPAEASI